MLHVVTFRAERKVSAGAVFWEGIRLTGVLIQMRGRNEPSLTSKREGKVKGLIQWQTSNLDSALLGLKERVQRINP